LGEIEEVLRQHSSVREAAAIVTQTANPQLVAYVVCDEEQSTPAAELKGFLSARLPAYMVPSAVVVLPRMPVTANGKLDRKALEEAGDWRQESSEYVAPATPTEKLISLIWEDLLGVRPIGVNHNFFDLGGHSLLAIRVMSRIREATGRGLPLAAIFNGPTVGQLAGFLGRYVPDMTAPGLIEIQGGTERPRLYLVPGVGEGNSELSRLARAIGPNQSVWGFRSEGASGIGKSVEETAAAYVDELLRDEPTGPYLIGGWSFGAIVAFEMA